MVGNDSGRQRRGSAARGARLTADERRTAVLAVALKAFARDGISGTSTEAIADAAGISQPYLFRLFGTKKQLFLQTLDVGTRAVIRAFEQAGEGLQGVEAFKAMGKSYASLIVDRDLLLIQLQGYAASGDPEIRAFMSARYADIVHFVADRTGLGPAEIREFFALGMLCNVTTALDLAGLDELWGDWHDEPDGAAMLASFRRASAQS